MPTFPSQALDVVSLEQAQAAADVLAPTSQLAVDVEADAMHAFRARLCFIQLGTDTNIFLFDTLAPGVTPAVLSALFADPQKTKFFHAAGGDLQFLSEVGLRVRGLFDTHRAATLLGLPKVGLADLVRERLGVELAKEHQQSDFSIRPTPPEMRAYIADDVRYLCEIGRQIQEECRKADISEEVELDCQRLADEAANRPDAGADYKPKIPRGTLSNEKLVLAEHIIKTLHAKRLEWAQQANVPMGRMLSNAALSDIAVKPPSSAKELVRLQGVRGGFVRDHGEEVLELVKKLGEQSARGELQPLLTKAPSDPQRRKREEKLKAFRTAESVARKVTPSVVLTNPLLEELAAKAPHTLDALAQVPYFGEKRLRLYGTRLLEILAG
jgi:ribonuclease D